MTMPSHIPPDLPPPARSEFVKVLAWTFIVLSVFATAMSVMRNIMVSHVAIDNFGALTPAEHDYALRFAISMFSHPRLISLLKLIMAAAILVAAIGLLKRLNWARLLFIGLLVLGILSKIGGVAAELVVIANCPPWSNGGAPEMPAGFGDTMTTMITTTMTLRLAMIIGFSILFGWIIKRLISPDIRREFGAL